MVDVFDDAQRSLTDAGRQVRRLEAPVPAAGRADHDRLQKVATTERKERRVIL